MKRLIRDWRIAIVVAFLSSLIAAKASALDSAAVLPPGMFALFGENRFYFPVDEVYNQDGKKENIAQPFNVPLVNLFAPGSGLNFGQSVVDIELKRVEMEYTLAYGLTSRLTVGAIIPYAPQADTNFQFRNDTTGANFGFVPGTLTACPLAAPGCQPANLQTVNAALGTAGFKPLGNRSDSGFGNVKVGGRYQYHRGNYYRGAFQGGVILPTGKERDPDDLLDQSIGNDAWGLFFQLHNDLMFQRPGLGKQLGFPDAGDFFFNYTIKYDLVLPDTQTLRVCPVTNPICTTKAKLDRDLGDTVTVEFGPAVGLLKGVILSGFYRYQYKLKDDYSGPPGVPVEVLERLSAQQGHEFRADLAFTSIPWVMQRQFYLPFVLGVSYRERFAGDNFANASRYIGFNLALYTPP